MCSPAASASRLRRSISSRAAEGRSWRAGAETLVSGISLLPKAQPDDSTGISRNSAGLPVPMDRVDPGHLFRLLDRLDVEIDDDRLVVAAYQHAFERLVGRGVD